MLGDPAPGDPSKVCECEAEETQSLASAEWVDASGDVTNDQGHEMAMEQKLSASPHPKWSPSMPNCGKSWQSEALKLYLEVSRAIGVPENNPFLVGIFHYEPSILGDSHGHGNPH